MDRIKARFLERMSKMQNKTYNSILHYSYMRENILYQILYEKKYHPEKYINKITSYSYDEDNPNTFNNTPEISFEDEYYLTYFLKLNLYELFGVIGGLMGGIGLLYTPYIWKYTRTFTSRNYKFLNPQRSVANVFILLNGIVGYLNFVGLYTAGVLGMLSWGKNIRMRYCSKILGEKELKEKYAKHILAYKKYDE